MDRGPPRLYLIRPARCAFELTEITMPRLKIELPASFMFKTEMPVRVGDVNYGGHLGNDSLLTLLHEARLLFLASKGMSELDAGGVGMIMSDAALSFKAEAFRGDLLEVHVAVVETGTAGFELAYKVARKSDGKEIARATSSMVFFDYAKRRVAKTPAKFLEAFPPY